jgi:hypothetical protein
MLEATRVTCSVTVQSIHEEEIEKEPRKKYLYGGASQPLPCPRYVRCVKVAIVGCTEASESSLSAPGGGGFLVCAFP